MSNNTTQKKYCQVTGCRYAWSHVTSSHLCGRCKQFGHGDIECDHESAKADLAQHSTGQSLPEELHCTVPGCAYKSTHQSCAHHCRLCMKNHSSHECPLTQTSKTISTTVLPGFEIECPLCRVVNKIAPDQKQVYGIKDQCVVCMENPCGVFLPTCGHVCLCLICAQELNQGQHYEWSNLPSNLSAAITSAAFSKMGRHRGRIYVVLSAGMGCSWYIRRASITAKLEGFFEGSGGDQSSQLNGFIDDYKRID